jgi:hypothetical protein
MTIGAISSLRDVREKLLGFSFEGVVRATGINRERLAELEKDNRSISVWESEALGEFYGVDGDALAEDVPHVPPSAVASTLASAEEFYSIGDSVRARVIAVANAAREIVRLRSILQMPPPEPTRVQVSLQDVAYKVGAKAAQIARDRFGLADHAILSVRDLFREEVAADLLYAHMGHDGPAGLTFASPSFGPVVALNLDGKNTNPCVRRFSLAHELYHLMVDWNHRDPLATLSGWLKDGEQFEREQRANSFAIRFLCPESKLPYDDAKDAAANLMVKWGLHYQAARLYLKNERDLLLPGEPPLDLKVTGAESSWQQDEKPDGIAGFPLEACPPERRTRVAYLAAQAYSRGLTPRDSFARSLGVSPLDDVENVLDHFLLDPPVERGVEAA